MDPCELTGFPWPAQETTGRDRYLQYREIRQALYAAATFPAISSWRAWLYNMPSSLDRTSSRYLADEDLLLMFIGVGGVVTAHTVAVLHAVHALGCRDQYFEDVANCATSGRQSVLFRRGTLGGCCCQLCTLTTMMSLWTQHHGGCICGVDVRG